MFLGYFFGRVERVIKPNPEDDEPFGRSRSSKAPTVPAGPEIQ
jgi:hypothetical protein